MTTAHTALPWKATKKKGLTSRKIIIVDSKGEEIAIANNELDAAHIQVSANYHEKLLDMLRGIVGNRNMDTRGKAILPSQLEAAWDILDEAGAA